MSFVELPAAGGLEVGAILASLVNHSVAGSDEVRPAVSRASHTRPAPADSSERGPAAGSQHDMERAIEHRRLLTLNGRATPVTLHIDSAGIGVEAPATVIDEAIEKVAWWFDVRTDPRTINQQLGQDPRLAPHVARRPALRPLRHPEGFEAAIDTVLGQQVTLAAARLFHERLRAAYSPGAIEGLRVFPTPTALAEAPVDELRAAVGLTRSRAATVLGVSRLFAVGFRLTPLTDVATARSQLRQVPGIGPWTVEYLALRALGDPDAFPASDAVVRRALDGLNARDAAVAAESWRPYRSWATAHLWASVV